MSARRSAGFLAFVFFVTAAPVAWAQETPARADEAQLRFDEGVRALRASDWAGALTAFEASRAIRETGSVVFNIAGCLRTLRRFADARRAYQRFLEIGTRPDQRAEATRAIEDLARNVVSVSVSANVDGAELMLDGRPVDRQPVDVDLGSEHVIEVRHEGHRPARETIRPDEPGPLTVRLELAALPPPPPVETTVRTEPTAPPPTEPPPPAPRDQYPSRGATWPWIVAGAALVLAGGAVAAYFAIQGGDEPAGDLTLHPR